MLAQEIIRLKRDGQVLARAHTEAFVQGLVDGSWSEGQAAAMAMAIFLKGLSRDETIDADARDAAFGRGAVLGRRRTCTARCSTSIPPAASATRSA